ncbi:DUF4783 domain-containing protein [Ancylomarina sp. 16SWW S1-10-2]|uniref:DUF4783 domain-containing protein n=1 Tax=Ancylomarina sp. 16SWW S1-10-2 TaxID=2499681 RepID=UPI0012ADA728|nr:DUF4783 domain-containing protein [Ancylomarina sp. 16SWW S1-10-2]MRT94488.1 DUF4783 domain-containing protein [Ancylomarina sp. 16SWW S1-10-2]
MRFIKYILIIAILGLSVTTFAQQEQKLPKGLVTAFEQGNSISLAAFFSDRIELKIQDKEAIYSRSQAKQIMAKFFAKYKPKSLKKKHIGGKANAPYFIGTLLTNNGNFRTTFLLKGTGNKAIIHRLSIEVE